MGRALSGLMCVDATSPVIKPRAFRAAPVRARLDSKGHAWLGTKMHMEDAHRGLVYWWVGSHPERKGRAGGKNHRATQQGDGCKSVSHRLLLPENAPSPPQAKFPLKRRRLQAAMAGGYGMRQPAMAAINPVRRANRHLHCRRNPGIDWQPVSGKVRKHSAAVGADFG